MILGDAGDGSGLGVAMQKNHGTVFLAASSMTQLSRPHFSAVRDPRLLSALSYSHVWLSILLREERRQEAPSSD